MTAARPLAVVVDPSEELVAGLGRIEGWLLHAGPEDDGGEAAVGAGAQAAAELASALIQAAGRAPVLYSSDGRTELVARLVISADLEGAVEALRRGLEAVPASTPSATTARVLDLLGRAAVWSRTDRRQHSLLAWRRAKVAELNRLARDRMAAAGRLTGPSLTTSDGTPVSGGGPGLRPRPRPPSRAGHFPAGHRHHRRAQRHRHVAPTRAAGQPHRRATHPAPQASSLPPVRRSRAASSTRPPPRGP